MNLDAVHSQGIFGCYKLVATTGGIIGRNQDATDEHMCVVLTPDSLYEYYYQDTLCQRTKVIISSTEERDGRRAIIITAKDTTDPDYLVASWRNDSLWAGGADQHPDQGGVIYVKCSR